MNGVSAVYWYAVELMSRAYSTSKSSALDQLGRHMIGQSDHCPIRDHDAFEDLRYLQRECMELVERLKAEAWERRRGKKT